MHVRMVHACHCDVTRFTHLVTSHFTLLVTAQPHMVYVCHTWFMRLVLARSLYFIYHCYTHTHTLTHTLTHSGFTVYELGFRV